MAGPGVNLATTKDGEAYNKLQRPPQHYLASTAPPRPAAASPVPPFKRKSDSAYPTPSQKRSRVEQEKGQGPNSLLVAAGRERVRDAASGMQVMLPGVDDEGHSSDGSTCDAIAYLRDVRSEASAIPHLLTGSTLPSHSHTPEHDGHVIFEQGTFIAVDGRTPDRTSAEDSAKEGIDALMPQDRYYELLLRRFYHLRATIETADPADNVSRLQASSAATMPRNERAWSIIVEDGPPNMTQISCLDEAAVFSGLQHFARRLQNASAISSSSGCWIWSLLASVGEVGTLSHEKIGRIRDMGQSAGLMAARLRNSSGGSQETKEDVLEGAPEAANADTDTNHSDTEMSISGDEGEVRDDAEVSDLERARACLLAQLGDRLVHPQLPSPTKPIYSHSPKTARHKTEHGEAPRGVNPMKCPVPLGSHPPSTQLQAENQTLESSVSRGPDRGDASGADLNTTVTIDMILTTVAECYGQRDLLAYRRGW